MNAHKIAGGVTQFQIQKARAAVTKAKTRMKRALSESLREEKKLLRTAEGISIYSKIITDATEKSPIAVGLMNSARDGSELGDLLADLHLTRYMGDVRYFITAQHRAIRAAEDVVLGTSENPYVREILRLRRCAQK